MQLLTPVVGLQDKGSQVYNVMAYGATGNGTTVDSTAVQSAISAAITAGGGIVFAPIGTYVVSGLYLGTNVTLMGAGEGATTFLLDPASATGSLVVRVSPAGTTATNVVVRDLTINGNQGAWGANSNQKGYGYYLGQTTLGIVTNCYVYNVEFTGCMSYALDIINVDHIYAYNVYIHDNGYTTGTGTNHSCDGFSLYGNDLYLIGCRADNNSHAGFSLGQISTSWARIHLDNCAANNNYAYNAIVAGASGITVLDVSIVGGSYNNSQTSYGVYLGTNAGRVTVQGVAVTGNYLSGICLSAASNNTVLGNTVTNNAVGGSTNPEIYLSSSGLHNAITANMVNSTNAAHAISEQNSSTDYNSIIGNNVTSTSTTIVVSGTHTLTDDNIGFDSASLKSANNLSDVASTTTTRGNLSAAKSGTNSDITSLTGLTTALPVSEGGTGAATLTGLVKGNGTSAMTAAASGTDYQVPIALTTTGTSGPATFSGGTLNIPQYSGGGSGITRSINSVSTSTTAGSTASTDYVYFCSGTITLTLPTAVSNLNRYTVKNTGTGVITVATSASQTIDGSPTLSITGPNQSYEVVSNNTNWELI